MKYTLQLILIGMLAGATMNAEDKPSAPSTAPVPNTAKLVVLKAEYGDLPDGTKEDVTVKVKAMVKDNALTVEATNDNFGDPVEGTGKKLKVEYSFEGGAKKVKEVDENETLTISDKGE